MKKSVYICLLLFCLLWCVQELRAQSVTVPGCGTVAADDTSQVYLPSDSLFVRFLQNRQIPLTQNNRITLLTSGRSKFSHLFKDIRRAKKNIHLEYFNFRNDSIAKELFTLLAEKAKEGVKVRAMFDDFGNLSNSRPLRKEHLKMLNERGIEIIKFDPIRFPYVNHIFCRDHQKIAVIDGKTGYTGGMNISDDYFVRWRDTHMRITGEAVSSLQYSFMNSFITSGGKIREDYSRYFPQHVKLSPAKLIQIVPDEPDNQWPVIQMGTVWAVQHARDYIYIQTPYFVPPEPLLQALESTALKGVDVRIMIPKKADLCYMGPANRSYYTECLEAGIKIYEKTGNFIHSKTLVADDYLSILGSANMDYRSFDLNYEINTYIYDESVSRENKAIFLYDLESCEEVTLEKWRKIPWYSKLLQSLIRLFAPLL